MEILNEIDRIKVKQLDIVATSTKLNLLEWVRKKVAVKMEIYKWKVVEYFNQRVMPRVFQPRDLVQFVQNLQAYEIVDKQ